MLEWKTKGAKTQILSPISFEGRGRLYTGYYICIFSLLGLPVPAVPAGLPSRTRKTPVKKPKTDTTIADSESTSESSEDSDEDWVPGSEEVRKRNKMIKRFIPGNKTIFLTKTVNNEFFGRDFHSLENGCFAFFQSLDPSLRLCLRLKTRRSQTRR